jgi:hypothetical protein
VNEVYNTASIVLTSIRIITNKLCCCGDALSGIICALVMASYYIFRQDAWQHIFMALQLIL